MMYNSKRTLSMFRGLSAYKVFFYMHGQKFSNACKKLFEQRDKSEACEDLDVGDMSVANFL